MIKGIDHFAIIASSEDSIAFYKRLGFSVVFEKKRSYDKVVLLEGCGIQIEMFIDPNHPTKALDKEPLGLRHIAFKIDDCDKMSEHFECSPISFDWLGKRYCNTRDPDGNVIEFHE